MIKTVSAFCSTFFMAAIFSLAVVAPCLAASDRIEAEIKDSSPVVIPLKSALGDAEYEKAINSGGYIYSGNLKCRLCHRDFFIGRKDDAHEHTFSKSIEDKYAANPRCLSCHTTGYGTDTGFKSIKETPKLADVQCEGCHGPGSKHNALNAKGGFLAGTDRPEILKKMCNGCHNARWGKSFKSLEGAFNAYKE